MQRVSERGGCRHRRARGVVLALGTVGLALGCSSEDDIGGQEAPAVAGAQDLVELVTEAGVACGNPAEFDPTANIAPDGFDYEKPTGLTCSADGHDLYLVAYESPDHRDEALDHGEITLDLCKIRSGSGEEEGWHSAVGANWRIASPTARSAIAQLAEKIDGAASEPFGCLFNA